MRITHPEPGPDRCGERHDRGTPKIFELERRHRVIVGVWQDRESAAHKCISRFEQLGGVGQERLFVGDDLQLHQRRAKRFPPELGREDGLLSGETASRVRKQVIAVLLEQGVEVFTAVGVQAYPAQRHSHKLGPGLLQGVQHHLGARIAGGAKQQP